MDNIFISLDLETTGLNPQTDKIIDIGAVKFNGEQILDEFQSMVNPGVEIPYSVQLLTGITPEQVSDAPSVNSVLPQLEEFLGNYPLVGHNVSFDISFLESNGLPLNNKIFDTFELASQLFPQASDFRLQAIAASLGIDVITGHKALPDAMTAMNVFNVLMERARKLPPGIISECIRLTEKAEWAFRDLFLNIQTRNTPLAGITKPVDIIGWLLPYVAEDGWKEYPVLKAGGKGETLDVTKVTTMFEPGGILSQGLSRYEYRREQADMAKSVTESFNESQNLILEAGTGTGKSLAYLVPASIFAITNQTRVVISSNNINLQEQLLNKDIPDLVKCPNWASEELRATALKGRANYLCLRRWNMLRQSNSLTQNEIKVLLRTIIWLATTATGDRSELMLLLGELDIWKQICSQEENCIGGKCHYNKRNYCFLYNARRRAEKAHLIITNHALVLSDLAVGNQVIPQYQYLVIDEAHHLEDEATNQLGFNISESVLLEYFNYLSRRLGGTVYAGFLAGIKAKSRAQNLQARWREEIGQHIDMLHNLVEIGRQTANNFYTELVDYLLARGNVTQDFEQRFRLTRELCNNSKWHEIKISLEPVLGGLKDLTETMSKLYSCLENLGSDVVADYDNIIAELFSLIAKGEDFRNKLNSAVINPGDEMINWVVLNKENNIASIWSAPHHVGELLHKSLFSQKDCTILTGATLTTDGNFNFIRKRLGIKDAGELIIGTTFNYLESTLVYVLTDIPEPDRFEYQRQLEKTLMEVSMAAHGRTLALFTSHNALRATYHGIKKHLEEVRILVLGQGLDGSPKKIIETFKSNQPSIMLGTSSFWEGVDIQGESLSVLVITRLPFPVPSDPIISARSEEYAEPFNDFMVPQSIIKFRQGFGRLIRSRRDRGVVVIADSRIQRRAYGQSFLNSLPLCQVKAGVIRNLSREIQSWLQKDDLKS